MIRARRPTPTNEPSPSLPPELVDPISSFTDPKVREQLRGEIELAVIRVAVKYGCGIEIVGRMNDTYSMGTTIRVTAAGTDHFTQEEADFLSNTMKHGFGKEVLGQTFRFARMDRKNPKALVACRVVGSRFNRLRKYPILVEIKEHGDRRYGRRFRVSIQMLAAAIAGGAMNQES